MQFLFPLLLLLLPVSLAATTWHVGPARAYTTPAAVGNLVDHGDTVLIDAALYANHPQVYFTKNNLYIAGNGGRPRLEAGPALWNNANGKALLVISGSDCVVEHLEFANAAVPDHNGAGIRQEGCDLTVRHCFFTGNEMGILGGNYADCKVTLEYNVFQNNGSPANPGYQHNVYINKIDTLIFQFNYSVNAIAEGHELKSRARNNIIRYNYIGNISTVDSRTIDLPNGGTALLVGNIIEQGQNSANSNIVGYGMEGLVNPPPHNLWMAHNTLVNRKNTGNFIQLAAGTDTFFLWNNILAGPVTSGLIQGAAQHFDSLHNRVHPAVGAAGFVDAAGFDYHLAAGSPAIDQGAVLSQTWAGYPLAAALEYADTASRALRPLVGLPDIGAYEFVPSVSTLAPPSRETRFFPNPVLDWAVLPDVPDRTPFALYDLAGRYVQGGIVLQGRIDLSRIPSGVYLLRVGTACVRLVKT